MMIRWIIPLCFGLLFVCFLTGCILNNVKEIEPDEPFAGLQDVYASGNATLNVVFVHGMGHHPFGDDGLLAYQMKIAEMLGFEESTHHRKVTWGDQCKNDYRDYPDFSEYELNILRAYESEGQAICALKINEVVLGFVGWRQYHQPQTRQTLNLFELSWDRATELLQKTVLELDDNYQETIELDQNLEPLPSGRDREADRARFNSWLKKFVNQNLGDPAIYIGDYGQAIQQIVAGGLTMIATKAGSSGEYEYSIISDSLGSRVVFDTLGCTLDGSNCRQSEVLRKSLVTVNALNDMRKTTSQVFMNANQLPFLALGNIQRPQPGESEKDWLQRFPCEGGGPRKLELAEQPITVVAFTDPSDALSYHLTQRFRSKCVHLGGPLQRPVKFINARVSNVKWDYFGLFANPDQAHSSGFRNNTEALRFLVYGYPN